MVVVVVPVDFGGQIVHCGVINPGIVSHVLFILNHDFESWGPAQFCMEPMSETVSNGSQKVISKRWKVCVSCMFRRHYLTFIWSLSRPSWLRSR